MLRAFRIDVAILHSPARQPILPAIGAPAAYALGAVILASVARCRSEAHDARAAGLLHCATLSLRACISHASHRATWRKWPPLSLCLSMTAAAAA
eukprot:6179228-Pleurochrysis_carterae.AAC.1